MVDPEEGTGRRADSSEPSEQEDPRGPEQALARARANARARGFRPGTAARVSPRRANDLVGRRGVDGQAEPADPQPLGDEVQRLVAQRGWDSEVQVGSVVGRWGVIVGDLVAEHVEPVSFEGTVLTVRADSTAWATQMKLLTHSVLARIDTEVGTGIVSDIVVHAPGGPSWRKGPLRAQGPGPRDTYG